MRQEFKYDVWGKIEDLYENNAQMTQGRLAWEEFKRGSLIYMFTQMWGTVVELFKCIIALIFGIVLLATFPVGVPIALYVAAGWKKKRAREEIARTYPFLRGSRMLFRGRVYEFVDMKGGEAVMINEDDSSDLFLKSIKKINAEIAGGSATVLLNRSSVEDWASKVWNEMKEEERSAMLLMAYEAALVAVKKHNDDLPARIRWSNGKPSPSKTEYLSHGGKYGYKNIPRDIKGWLNVNIKYN